MSEFDVMAHDWVKRAIRTEMVKQGITFGELAERLVMVGADENERNLRNKIARGTFSAALFAQCLAAMGSKSLNIDLLDRMYAGSDEFKPRLPSSNIILIIKLVREAIHRDAPAGSPVPGLKEVKDALDETDLSPLDSGAASLDEIVRMIRKTIDSKRDRLPIGPTRRR